MPAFGCNPITIAFAERILNEPIKGFRLSDRIVSAIDRFVGALSRFLVPGEPGVMNRWLFIYPFVGSTDWTHSLNLADAPNSGYQGGQGVGVGPYAPTGKFERYRITWSGAVTHNDFGVTPGSGTGNTNCDMANTTSNFNAWNRRSQGYYSRTNSATTDTCLWAGLLEPRNGYTYYCGGHPRYTTGDYYGYLNYYAKSGVATVPNTVQVAVSDSLGLFSDNQRGPLGAAWQPYHYTFKRGALIGGENSGEVGMGYGDVGSNAWMAINGNRNLAFVFSTRYLRTMGGPRNSDGTGGQLAGDNPEFNFFVEQLQVALLRNV
jgi:hypothetical protein